MRRLLPIFFLLLASLTPAAAQNYTATAGSGLTFGAKSSASVLYPYFIGCDATTVTQCWAVDASGRLTVNLASGSTVAVTQATAANLNATVVGNGTFAVQATLQASATTAIGKVDPNTIGNWGLAASTQNGSTPTNAQVVMGQFNTTPTTITSGNISPLQMDSAGNLLANVKVSALPASAATSTNQATEITSLATIATNTAAAIPAGTNLVGNTGQVYPAGSTPITASATGTTTATTATLAANASLHTYICGFSIRANAAAAATNNATVTGTVTATMNFTQWTAPNASGLGVTEEVFSPCVISSAINTGIAVVSGAPGTSGVVSVSAWGYQL